MSKKRILWIAMACVMALAVVFAAVACEEDESTAGSDSTAMVENPAIGVVLPTKDEPRWLQDEARFNQLFADAGYDIQILFSQKDSAVEKQNVDALITQGVKVIILCPVDGAAAGAAAEAARDAGVIMISYDRAITGTDAVDFIVTFDQRTVGTAQGEYLVDAATGTGLPLYLYAGDAADDNAFLFFDGAWEQLQPKIADGTFIIKNSPEAVALQDKLTLTRQEMGDIIAEITTEWDFDTAKNLAEANLTAATAADKGDVFILAPNDGTARAIGDAFAADPDVTSYAITGQDVEKPSIQYIIDGKQSMSVFKDTRALTTDALTAAEAFLNGETPVSNYTLDNGVIDVPGTALAVVVVTKDNIKEALIDTGYYEASDFTGL